MKWARLWLPALLVAAVLLLASCGNTGSSGGSAGGGNNGMEGMNHGDSGGETSGQKTTGGGMAGMDHSSMDDGSMSSGAMAGDMVMEDGRYSDKAFIDAMVPHHQGAIAMANVALKNAEHEELKQLSRNIIPTQQAEIEELKTIKKEAFGTSQVPMEMSPSQMRSMGMMGPQQLAHREPFDKAFIDAMIPHHRSAIEMAKVAHEKSKIPEIKQLAEKIVSAQQREIEQMKQWRKEWYPEG